MAINESLIDLCNWLFINFTGVNGISSIASIAVIITLIGAIIKYFSRNKRLDNKKEEEVKAERKRAYGNINIELEDAIDGLDRAKHPADAKSFVINNHEYFFMNRRFNHDFYDSLVYSGKINFLEEKLQQPLQNIFQTLKTHNKYLDLVDKMNDEDKETEITSKAIKYYDWMDVFEIRLLQEIPKMQKKLKG